MAKNPVTGLEEDNTLKAETATNLNLGTGLGESTLEKFPTIQTTNKSPVTIDSLGKPSTGLTPIKDTEITPKATELNSVTGTEISTKKELSETETPKSLSVIPKGTPKELPVVTGTGIGLVDTEIDKLRIEKEKKLKETTDSFNIQRGVFEDKKEDFTNFDAINSKFDTVLSDIRTAQSETGTDLTPEQISQIALKNGITEAEVTNPSSIFNLLELSDKGEEATGIKSAQAQIDKITTDFNRGKENLEFQLEGQRVSLNNQIADTRKQLSRNIAWATAAGAWSGGLRGSGYEQGIQNIKDDGQSIITKLVKAKNRLLSADDTNIKRLTDDYELAITDAKNTLDKQIEGIKFDTGLQMNGLEGKFGLGTKELTNALNSISEEFGVKSLKVFDQYLGSMKKINDITNDNIERQEKINNLVNTKMNKRFKELGTNKALLSNTNLNDLTSLLTKGELTIQGYDDLKSLMLSSINQTLAKRGIVDEGNLTTIDSLLDNGLSPAQIVAKMGGLDKFQPKEKEVKTTTPTTKRFDLGGGRIRIENADGTVEEFQDGERVEAIIENLGQIDFSQDTELINRFPNEAAFKNNNPAGITDNLSSNGKKLLENAGIPFRTGTPRPESEGGNYILFNNAEDGVNAQKVLLSEAGSNDIRARLEQWVGTANGPAYATDLMSQAGIAEGTKFTDLSDNQLDTLVAVQMKRESPNYFNELVNQTNKKESSEVEVSDNFEREVLKFTQGLPGTGEERADLRQSIIDEAREQNISLLDAKKSLGITTGKDVRFEKNREKSYNDAVKTLGKMTGQARTTLTLLDEPQTAIGDVASVVGFLKTIDPTSVARESEVSSVENARGIIDGMSNIFAKTTEGTTLTPKQRGQLKNAITTIVNAADNRHADFVRDLDEEFNERGLDSSLYISKKDRDKLKVSEELQEKASGLGASAVQFISQRAGQKEQNEFIGLD